MIAACAIHILWDCREPRGKIYVCHLSSSKMDLLLNCEVNAWAISKGADANARITDAYTVSTNRILLSNTPNRGSASRCRQILLTDREDSDHVVYRMVGR